MSVSRTLPYCRVTTGAGKAVKAGKAGKPILFSDREAGKAKISTFKILKKLLQLFFGVI